MQNLDCSESEVKRAVKDSWTPSQVKDDTVTKTATIERRGKLEFRLFQPEDGPSLSSLHGEVFGRKIDPDYWTWKYYQNPAGPHDAYVALDSGRIVGNMTAIPVRMKVGDQELTACQTCDIVIAPSYRRSTPFFRMFKLAYKEVEKHDWQFIYGLPLESTFRLGTRMLGFKSSGALKSLVKVLDPTLFLRKKIKSRVASGALGAMGVVGLRLLNISRTVTMKKVEIRKLDQFDHEFHDLWNRCKDHHEISVIREPDYLNWRYFQNPINDYKVFAAYRDGECLGFVVLCIKEKDGFKRCFVIDLMTLPGDTALIKCLLGTAVAYSYREGVDSINTWMLEHTDAFPVLREMGFVERDTPHYLIVRPGESWSSGCLDERTNWFLTIGDSDHY